MYTTNRLRVPTGGFHPFVGMHSVGEAVRLLEKEPWQPSKEEEVGVGVVGGVDGGARDPLCTTQRCHHQSDCIKMGGDVSHSSLFH